MSNNQGEIFRKYIKSNDIPIKDIIKKTGKTRATINNWYKVVEFTPNQLALLEKAHISKDIFINIKSGENNKAPETSARPLENYNIKWVPLVNQRAYAGFLNGYADQEYIDELPTVPFEVDREYRGNYVCFEVWGDSMDVDRKESFSQGDIVLCREINRDHWRDKLHIDKWPAFVIVHDESIVIKKIIKHDVAKGIIMVHSLNPLYDDYEIELSNVKMIFNVVTKKTNF